MGLVFGWGRPLQFKAEASRDTRTSRKEGQYPDISHLGGGDACVEDAASHVPAQDSEVPQLSGKRFETLS